uniref:THO complex subunit 1 (Trinotate prediction) n=1 Tax=Henneguya salminicola TaxID=69463 RepID=A0A6G3MEM1_HENSL
MENEEIWSDWKNRACPNIANQTFEIAPATFNRDIDLKKWDFSTPNTFDNPRLNYLWNICPDNMEACKVNKNRKEGVQTLDAFINERLGVNSQSFLESSENKTASHSWFQWRVLRLLARECPQFFSPSPTQALASYINSLIQNYINNG